MKEPNWADFIDREPPKQIDAHQAELDELCAIALTTPHGKALLGALRKRFIDANQNPLAQPESLRVRATQMQFVRDLEVCRDRGLLAIATRQKAQPT